jgi:hypothetical protein
MVTSTLRSTPRVALAALALLAAACGGSQDNAPESGSVAVQLARPRVALGSPVDMTYRFTLAPGAAAIGNRKVFVHFLDADDEQMWTDDHDPPTPTSAWTPGQTVEYTRTMFVPVYPYVGQAKVVVGLYDPASGERVRFSGTERGGRAYEVAQVELLPQTENVFLIYKDGWHSVESAQDNSLVEWQWMRKEATLSFRNPRRDSVLYLQADNPVKSANAATSLEVRIGDQVIATVPVRGDEAPVHRLPLTAAQLGAADMVELKLVTDKTLVPALEQGSGSSDSRELGARVFHAFVQPQGS